MMIISRILIVLVIITNCTGNNSFREGIWSINKNYSTAGKQDDISNWHIQMKTFSPQFQKMFSSNGLNNFKSLMRNMNIVFIGNEFIIY